LHRRNSQIEKNAVDRLDRASVEDAGDGSKVGMNEGQPRIGDRGGSSRRIRIRIDCNQPGGAEAQNRSRMSARAERRVHVRPPGANGEILHRRCRQDRNVIHARATSEPYSPSSAMKAGNSPVGGS